MVELAHNLNYPEVLLRVSMSSYRTRRRIVTDFNVTTLEMEPTRGIVAGAAQRSTN